MSEHVAKILQMTRLEAGALRVERDWVAFDELVGSVLARLRERLAAHRLIVELPKDLPLLRVDAPLIEQALGNLLENAAKHTPAGTVVRLRARRQGAEFEVIVEDYGGGLGAGEAERVFEKFHHGSLEGSGGGVGLGLAICRAIVRLHGGQAWAEQVPDGGSAFHFTLPIEAPPAPPPDSEPIAA
jgi:two-component system sensor histidine kinase KdpD